MNQDLLNLIRLVKKNGSIKPIKITPDIVKLANYHSITPLLRQNNQTAIQNLLFQSEVIQVNKFLKKTRYEHVWFKGLFFEKQFYEEQNIRSTSDLDLIIKKENLKDVISLFLQNGYTFNLVNSNFKKQGKSQIIDYLIHSNIYEISLTKGNRVDIDLHWGIYPEYFQYKFPINNLFKNITTFNFHKEEVQTTSIENTFWLLIIHHGSKEFWLRLKHFQDLKTFLIKYQSVLDWEKILVKSKEYKLNNITINGFLILEKYFEHKIPIVIKEKRKKLNPLLNYLVLKYWANAKHWGKPIYRMHFEVINILNQDKPFSILSYYHTMVMKTSKISPMEEQREYFNKSKSPFLKFIGKFIANMKRN